MSENIINKKAGASNRLAGLMSGFFVFLLKKSGEIPVDIIWHSGMLILAGLSHHNLRSTKLWRGSFYFFELHSETN